MKKYWYDVNGVIVDITVVPDDDETEVEGAVGFTEIDPDDGRMVFIGGVWIWPLSLLLERVNDSIYLAMNARLEQGIFWALNNGDTPKSINLNDSMQHSFTIMNALRGRGRSNPHKGEIWDGSTRFSINDIGLDELLEFAGAWGLAISQIARAVKDAVQDYLDIHTAAENLIYLNAFDAGVIDWTIDWSTDLQNDGKGWNNDTVLQNP